MFMSKHLALFAIASFLCTAGAGAEETPSKPGSTPARMVKFDTPEGQALLDPDTAVDYPPLKKNWVAQLDSHCGAASTVVVQNALRPEEYLTQNDLFTDETAHIITQDVVYRIGLTLEEVTKLFRVRTGLNAERFHAGDAEGFYSYEAFRDALIANRESSNDHLIINYPLGWVRGKGNVWGHFSPIADFNEEENMVLVLEISERWPMVWIDARDLYGALATVDSVSGINRGWVRVWKDQPAVSEASFSCCGGK